MTLISELLHAVDEARKSIRTVEGDQVQSKAMCGLLHNLAGFYYDPEFHNCLPAQADEVARADQSFSQLHELSRRKPSKQKCLDALTEAKKSLVSIEGLALTAGAQRSAAIVEPIDSKVISTLDGVCPVAAASYRQGLADLAAVSRTSWRGSATEFREALRETLDTLAPDSEVQRVPGFKREPDTHGPTMKQKAKFILKRRGAKSAQVDHSVGVVESVEDMLGGITRSVYRRSSVSTHTPTDRAEVVRLHLWVRLLLCELLALPLH